MFCSKCGANIPDGTRFCPTCGANLTGENINNHVNNFVNNANSTINNMEGQLGDAINDVKQSFNGQQGGSYDIGERLQTDRSLLMYILLSIITCGIYSYYFVYKMAHDVNIACEGDGAGTGGLVAYILLSFITCGFYSIYWEYSLGNRLAENAPRYGMTFTENGTTVLMWIIFGSLLCGIGYFVGTNILIKNSNKICLAYNRKHGF
ncbi:MAG: DUF4234 domain-containing protein [Lachnospiraceae bacterium]|nr:DUF4234 domain-containing protein [Lachnospiraceae bacterium]